MRLLLLLMVLALSGSSVLLAAEFMPHWHETVPCIVAAGIYWWLWAWTESQVDEREPEEPCHPEFL